MSTEEVWNHCKSICNINPTTVATELGISLKDAVMQLDKLSKIGKLSWTIDVVCPRCMKVGYTCHYFNELPDEITCAECGEKSLVSLETAVVWFENLEPNTELREETKTGETE